MNKSEETNKLIKRYEDSACILSARERTLFDICKSLAIIADKLTEENFSIKDATDLESYSTRLWNKAYDRGRKETLEKIRTEIEQITDTMGVSYNQYVSKIDVLEIIDKYKSEREGKQ